MGTRWRGLLAPINMPTGDGRRFKEGGVTFRQPPFGLKWQRVDEAGHDTSVIIGSTDTMNIGTVKEAIANDWINPDTVKAAKLAPGDLGAWGAGEMFDDHPELPRLAEDVAEAMLLVEKGLLGPSVDAGAAEAIEVREGSDEPLTEADWDAIYAEWEQTGEQPKLEMLFTAYEIAAATLVGIPAFAETSRPFELIASAAPAEASAPALVAALTAAAPTYPDEWFANPQLTEVTPITVTADGRVYGHAAEWGVCHVGIPGMCTTAPQTQIDYAMFHRYVQSTPTGIVSTGRLTTGHGRVGTGCTCCPGKDDHACDEMTLGQAIDHYDRLKTLAWIRAGEDEHGIWIAGALAGKLDRDDERVLNRRCVSGDWRDVAGNWELTEVLALAKARPGFPLSVKLRNGRQTALIAAGGINPDRVSRPALPSWTDAMQMARSVANMVLDGLKLNPIARQQLTVTAAATEQTGAMVALVPSEKDAARLAVDGGEPAAELHATRAYLGEAAAWSPEHQAALSSAMEQVAGGMAPIEADGFALSMFNPAGDDPCVVLGLGGAQLAQVQDAVMAALEPFAGLIPAQHTPKVEHLTLQFTDDAGQVAALVDRAGPVMFDRLRVVFAGQATDYPLSGKAPSPEADTAAALIAEVELAVGDVDPDAIDRAAVAAGLLTELEATNV